MTTFFDVPGILPEFVALNRSRTSGAGLDPFEYDRVTAPLTSLYDWPAALRDQALAHRAAAVSYETEGRTVSAGEAYRVATRWFHCAVLLPHPDREFTAQAAREADEAMGRALAHLDPTAVRLAGEGFTGRLRRPAAANGSTVIVIPGLDSSKEEFHDVTEALLRRGTAVFSMDGPGQGVLAATTVVEADYQRVVSRVIDALGLPEVGVIGMSLGGYYAAVSAAHEPRIRAAAAVSGPFRLTWEKLPPFVTDTLTQRAGSIDAAREFAGRVDLRDVAARIACPLRVVEGGTDDTPGVAPAERLAADAPRGELLLVPHGDHLLGNARADWLPSTADWLVGALG